VAPVLALTQGDPAGVGPEILLRLLEAPAALAPPGLDFQPLLVAERPALEALRPVLPRAPWERLVYLDRPPAREEIARLAAGGALPVLDPVGRPRRLTHGASGPHDAGGALAALDAGIALARAGAVDALVTAPVSKGAIARHCRADFRGHTDYLARACGLERYGRDYLMAFLAPDLQVALLTTHMPLVQALHAVSTAAVLDALLCLHRHAPGRVAVAGLNPHAGEGGLLGTEDAGRIAPAVALARQRGVDACGPESPDSLFARARRGEFDWVLALYHDQGLVAVKTAAFGLATNWTLGLPFLRTSVDHGTAFEIAGKGIADARPLAAVVATTLRLVARELPRGRLSSAS
jgi:4-hydroxythreonine-4-phosphate dehydrogenase